MLNKIPWKFVLPALLLGCLLAFALLALIGPAIGNTFSTIESDLAYAPAAMIATPSAAEPIAGSQGELASAFPQAPRLIISTVHMSLVVRDTAASLAQIENLATESGGYVTSSNTQGYEEGSRASVTIRVPSERLDEVLEQLRELALEVRSENRSGQDVTEEYVDLNARLEILEAAEQELLELYQTRQASGEVADILEVYRQLVTFRQEIESLTGRIQYLQQSAALATVTLELTPDVLAQPIEVGGWRPEGTARAAFQALISGLQFLADAIIWSLILLLPLAVVVGIPIYGLWRLVRRRRTRQQPPPTQ
jgi:hypothetical protein